jgi:hypothetical protein
VVLYVPATTSVPTTNVPSPKLLAGPDCVGGGVGGAADPFDASQVARGCRRTCRHLHWASLALERGERALDSRSLIVALARALDISPSELTALPIPAPGDGGADAAIDAIRRALQAVTMSVRAAKCNPSTNSRPVCSRCSMRNNAVSTPRLAWCCRDSSRTSTGTVALSDRLTRTGPPACLEAPQQAFRCPVCHGFPTCLRAGLPVLVGGLDALRLNATAPSGASSVIVDSQSHQNPGGVNLYSMPKRSRADKAHQDKSQIERLLSVRQAASRQRVDRLTQALLLARRDILEKAKGISGKRLTGGSWGASG